MCTAHLVPLKAMSIYRAGLFAFLMIRSPEKAISSSSTQSALQRSLLCSVVGEATETVIVKLTNAIKPLKGAGEGCCESRHRGGCCLQQGAHRGCRDLEVARSRAGTCS